MISEPEINQYGFTALDGAFQPLLHAGLAWYPWVGKNYLSAPVKVWIIAESHYINHSGDNQQAAQNPLYTRRIAAERIIPQYFWTNPTLDRINQTMAGRHIPPAETHLLWQNAAFSNLIQRPMSSPKERPSPKDIAAGWNIFPALLNILKPDYCLFMGLAAINRLDTRPNGLNAESPKWTQDKIGNAYAREPFTVSTDKHQAQAAAIRHPGRYFNAQKWHIWLRSNFSPPMEYLQQNMQ